MTRCVTDTFDGRSRFKVGGRPSSFQPRVTAFRMAALQFGTSAVSMDAVVSGSSPRGPQNGWVRNMKTSPTAKWLVLLGGVALAAWTASRPGLAAPVHQAIKVDHFGYRPADAKVAVF